MVRVSKVSLEVTLEELSFIKIALDTEIEYREQRVKIGEQLGKQNELHFVEYQKNLDILKNFQNEIDKRVFGL